MWQLSLQVQDLMGPTLVEEGEESMEEDAPLLLRETGPVDLKVLLCENDIN
jgi:hypothetical protein